jgi:hypothetical protein
MPFYTKKITERLIGTSGGVLPDCQTSILGVLFHALLASVRAVVQYVNELGISYQPQRLVLLAITTITRRRTKVQSWGVVWIRTSSNFNSFKGGPVMNTGSLFSEIILTI